MRPTAKDVATVAGVSLATVDRVLNDRPNVSRSVVLKVSETIKQLGFVRNSAAVSLARSKCHRFQFVLPTSGDLYLAGLLRQMREAQGCMKSDFVDLDIVQIPTDDPHQIAKHLSTIDAGVFDGIALMAPYSPHVGEAISRLICRGVAFVHFLCGQGELNSSIVGVDNFAAGATAAKIIGRFVGGRTGKVLIVADTMRSLDSVRRRRGFDGVIRSQFSHLRCLPPVDPLDDESKANQILKRVLETHKDVVAIYVLGSEARIALERLSALTDLRNLTVVVHEKTPFSEDGLRDGRIDAVIAHDCEHAIRSAIGILRSTVDALTPLVARDKIRIEVLIKENL